MSSPDDGVRVRVLGPIELARPDGPDPLTPRLRRLLAGLLISRGSVVSVDALAELMWRDVPPDDTDAALHSLIARLRGRLRSWGNADAALLTRSPGYLLHLPAGALDADRFEQLTAAGRAAAAQRPEEAEELFAAGLALWRGAAYAEWADEDFARPESARLAEARLVATEDRAAAALNAGRSSAAAIHLQPLVEAEPLRERPHRQLMLAHYREGRQAEALAVARAYRERLADELGLDATPELRELETAILRQDPALDGPAPSTAPAAASSSTAEAAGPPVTQGLVGRDEELADLVRGLQPGGLVTLTGPGGVGKTTLARAAAQSVVERFPDGRLTVELAAVTENTEVAAAVGTALRLQPRPGTELADRVVAHLAGRRMLLVLDNCEHLRTGTAALAEAVVDGCPDVAILATSRVPLEIRGERVWLLPTLATPAPTAHTAAAVESSAAVQLFVRRATDRRRDFRLDDANAEAVAELCRRLDGLPLALELAAARMSALTPGELAERLSWRFRLLHGGPRSPERHRTLRSVVDWSYALLPDDDRRCFEIVSVFAGDFTLTEAERLLAALDAPAEVGSLLGLVDSSMITVVPGSPTRYVLLETLRAYGREQLAGRGATDRARGAHAELYADLAEDAGRRLFAPGQEAGVAAVDAAFDEVRAAWTWALRHELPLAVRIVGGLGCYVEHRLPAEVAGWAEQTVAAAAAAAGPDRELPGLARAYGVAGAGQRFAGQLDRARELVECGLALPHDQWTGAYLRYLLSEISLFQGRLVEVAALSAEVVAAVPEHAGFGRMAALMITLAATYGGDAAGARERAEQLYAAEQREPTVLRGWTTYVLAEALLDTEPERAAGLLTDTLAEARRTSDRYLAGVALVAAAAGRSRHGDPKTAAPLFAAVIEHWRDAGDWVHQWTTLRNVVELLIRLGRDEDAAVLYGGLTRTGAGPTYGEDAERMAAAERLLEQRLGGVAYAEAHRRGTRSSDAELVARARTALTGEPPAT